MDQYFNIIARVSCTQFFFFETDIEDVRIALKREREKKRDKESIRVNEMGYASNKLLSFSFYIGRCVCVCTSLKQKGKATKKNSVEKKRT